MNDWHKPCEHGNYDRHPLYKAARHPDGRFIDNFISGKCPGGSPVTAADLEGEKVWWCEWHGESPSPFDGTGDPVRCYQGVWTETGADECSMVERLLIPIPDPSPDGAQVKTPPELSGEVTQQPQQPSGEVKL